MFFVSIIILSLFLSENVLGQKPLTRKISFLEGLPSDVVYDLFVDKNGKWEYVFSTELDKPLPKVDSDSAKVVLKDLQTTPIKREFDLEKHTWMDSLRFHPQE